MNILFLTLLDIASVKEHTIYTDLLRQFIMRGDSVYIVSPYEKKIRKETCLIEENGDYPYSVLKPRIGNMQKTNTIEKGISTVTLEGIIRRAIQKYWHEIHFDLVLYSTPPITLTEVIRWLKKRDNSRTYLLLKDIFPQNAVDLGMLSANGPKSVLYKFFRRKEKQLYALSDRIGCMSMANVEYVVKHNPEVDPSKVEVCPNSIEVQDVTVTPEQRVELRTKYGIPLDKIVFVYGGNLGKPQGVPFIIECLRACQSINEAFFLIVGDGTDYGLLENFVSNEKPPNVLLIKSLPKDEYDRMIAACDIGLIFLDHRFTIPNFPSRLLAYMQARLPVLACTDTNTDIGRVIMEGGFGWWCESSNVQNVISVTREIMVTDYTTMGDCGYKYIETLYSVVRTYKIIMSE